MSNIILHPPNLEATSPSFIAKIDTSRRLTVAGANNFTTDLSPVFPWKLKFCNLDGGEPELCIGVIKKSPLHQVLMKRLFFYNLGANGLIPKYRMSRTVYPFLDAVIRDVTGDGHDDLITLEFNDSGNFVLGLYEWQFFGFERTGGSTPLDDVHIEGDDIYIRNEKLTDDTIRFYCKE